MLMLFLFHIIPTAIIATILLTLCYLCYLLLIYYLSPQPNPIRHVLSLCPRYTWEKWGSERTNNLPQVTEMRWGWNPGLCDSRSKFLTTQYCKLPAGKSWVFLILLGFLMPGHDQSSSQVCGVAYFSKLPVHPSPPTDSRHFYNTYCMPGTVEALHVD